jgi:hypothetical protein
MPTGPLPIFRASGEAAASYVPGHPFAEVQVAVGEEHITCTAVDAWDLLAVLMQALGAQPPTETPAGPGR